MSLTQEEVLAWIKEGCNYAAGIQLLYKTGRHKGLIRNIIGREHRYAEKLRYELEKAVGIYGQANMTIVADTGTGETEPGDTGTGDTGTGETGTGDTGTGETGTGEDTLPDPVKQVIKEHSLLFKERSIMHDAMASVPDDNTPANVEQRKKLSDHIAEHSAKIDALFTAKEDFYKTGKLPDLESLFKKEEPDPEVEELPDDVNDLKKKKKNLQTANTKDQNLLDFQTEAKGEKPSPMPEGPRRLKIELRIQNRNLVIRQIDEKLVKIVNEK